MYLPQTFAQSDSAAIAELMRAFPLATLVTQGAQGPCVNHIPLYYLPVPKAQGVLSGHIPRANSLWEQTDSTQALAVFHGPNAYIRPAWYAAKQRTGKVVPTWNYAVVHARGTLRFMHDAEWIAAHLDQLTQAMEAPLESPWSLGDAPADYRASLLEHLVGIELRIDSVLGKWKLSQNRSEQDRSQVAEGLRQWGRSDAELVADLVDRAGREKDV